MMVFASKKLKGVTMKTRVIAGFLAVLFFASIFSGCVTSTNVRFSTNIDGAAITVDGENIGKTPTQTTMSNAIWENPDIVIKKDGYKDLHVDIKKEVKVVNLVCGLLLFWPSLLWVYGPKANQNFELMQNN
jgi:hypothetical protein